MPIFSERESILEAMLFASPDSVPLVKLAEALGCDVPMTRELLLRMEGIYKNEASGIQLIAVNDAYRLCTNPIYAQHVQKLLSIKPRRPLSTTLLETLSIIAFKQPVTRNVIEEIRGVNSDHAVNKLLEYNLIEESGRLDAPGRPILFATSEDFLMYYGLKNVKELLDAGNIPDSELEQLTLDAAVKSLEEQAALVDDLEVFDGEDGQNEERECEETESIEIKG